MASSRPKRRQGGRRHAESVALARACACAADEKKARDTIILDLRKRTSITDYFVIATAGNPRQVAAIAEAVAEEAARGNARMIGREGTEDSGWVLLDFADVVVHVFDAERRDLYDLGLLWGDAPRVDWQESAKPPMNADERG